MLETITRQRLTELTIAPAEERINTGNARRLRKELGSLVAANREIVLDLRHVAQMDSAGAGLLLDLYHRLQESGGRLRVTGLRPAIRLFFELLRLDQVLELHPAGMNLPLPVAA